MIPLFKSQYSLGRSILTLDAHGTGVQNGPDSIVDIAVENKFNEVFLVDDSMTGFLQAYKNLKDHNIKLIFGLRLSVCSDMHNKSEEELGKTSKSIIFAKNKSGYERLIKISTDAARNGFYYQPRIDYKTLASYWSEDDLTLCIPFYDSFLYYNTLTSAVCLPDFSFTTPTMFVEDNDLPFDDIIRQKVESYAASNDLRVEKAKSIYYINNKDFKAYLTFRCVNNRSTLNKPNLEHMCSDKFSFESWKEKNDH